MAGEIPDLHAEVRTGTGKGAARATRRENYVPGIVYGGDKDPLPIKIPFNALLKHLKAGRFLATLFDMKVEGQEDVRVICRAVERDVVKDLPTRKRVAPSIWSVRKLNWSSPPVTSPSISSSISPKRRSATR